MLFIFFECRFKTILNDTFLDAEFSLAGFSWDMTSSGGLLLFCNNWFMIKGDYYSQVSWWNPVISYRVECLKK